MAPFWHWLQGDVFDVIQATPGPVSPGTTIYRADLAALASHDVRRPVGVVRAGPEYFKHSTPSADSELAMNQNHTTWEFREFHIPDQRRRDSLDRLTRQGWHVIGIRAIGRSKQRLVAVVRRPADEDAPGSALA